MAIRFLTSGESHGKCLNAIIEGIGSGYKLDFDFINNELKNRQKGKGRGGRMQIEADEIEIKSGVRFGITTGAPICIEIKNKDFENWKIPMSVYPIENSGKIEEKKITCLRPGHADYPGAVKYNTDDIRNILERSSARETAARVAAGAICRNILLNFGIEGSFEIISIGGEEKDFDKIIEEAKKEGVSLGGLITVKYKNVPVGLGSFVHWDRRLDGLLAQALMSIPAIKSVEIGLGREVSKLKGNKVHDEIFFENGKITRHTNNAGGIEGGMTNGEEIVLTCAMKPIPTMKCALNSIDIKDYSPSPAHFERADTCAVEACGCVALNMAAITILNAFLDKFGGDSLKETLKNYENAKE
ncbi:MAG: chorismate synthase [Candidatus Gastranaerophilales bacterium]|nr:chorismate synthase [Candidatus Gastranaerophilales bacterium]